MEIKCSITKQNPSFYPLILSYMKKNISISNSTSKNINLHLIDLKPISDFKYTYDDTAIQSNFFDTLIQTKYNYIAINSIYLYLQDRINYNQVQNKTIGILGDDLLGKIIYSYFKKKNHSSLVMIKNKEISTCSIENIDILFNTMQDIHPDDINQSPFFQKNLNCSCIYDFTFNNFNSTLIQFAKERKIKAKKGIDIEYEIISSLLYTYFQYTVQNNTLRQLKYDMYNIILIGMPSCGKSTIGKSLSKILHKPCVDIDIEIEKREKKCIKDIFDSEGEFYFRQLESNISEELSNSTGKIISTGGGVIKNKNNIYHLKSNGLIVFIDRNFDQLICDDASRPLSNTKENLLLMYNNRMPFYKAYADMIVQNNGTIDTTIAKIFKALSLYFSKECYIC